MLRITGIPGTHDWEIRGPIFGRDTQIARGSLFGMLRKRTELEAEREAEIVRESFLAFDESAPVEYVRPC